MVCGVIAACAAVALALVGCDDHDERGRAAAGGAPSVRDAGGGKGGMAGASEASPASGGEGTDATAPEAAGGTPVDAGLPRRVLFVGNSYTAVNDLPAVVRELGAATPGGAVEVEAIAPGGALLENHWNSPETRGRVESGEFAVVVLQAQSVEPIVDPESFLHFGTELSKAARAAGARPVWFATWARREGDALYDQFPVAYRDAPTMTRSLEFRYLGVAGMHQDVVARVGAAWEIARTELPEVPLYAEDGSHPSVEGTLLSACVLFPWITGRPARLPDPPPLGVPRGVAEQLCAIEPRVRCPEKKTFCDGACVDVQLDAAHCGACGESCGEDDPCREGVCGCEPGRTGCSRSCVDLQKDPRHCGTCDARCEAGEICVAGACACPSAHLLQPALEELSALEPACAFPSHDYGKVACAAAGHALCRKLGCFTSGFGPASGHSAAHDGSVACVAGEVRQTTYTALAGFEAACNGPAETPSAACVTAIHRYCASVGAVSGYGPVGQDGDAVTVTCLPQATVVQTTLDALRAQASRCLPDPVLCTTASSSFCAEEGHLGGFGPVEVSGEAMTVVCVDP